jgi:glucuronate isomerase
VEQDHRQIWQTFADYFYLFHGTPTGMWLNHILREVLGVEEKLTGESAQDIYNQISATLQSPEFTPRRLYKQFNVEVICTTDAAIDPLTHHQAVRESGWDGRILPTFRPDSVVNIYAPHWRANIDTLSNLTGLAVHNYATFIQALENRRAFFKTMGALAADHDAPTPFTAELSPQEADAIFQRALAGAATTDDGVRFTGHMLMEMARMSLDDGMVMQLHSGSVRNHNRLLFEQFGPDTGGDLPRPVEFTRSLQPLLNKYGNDPRFTLILFTLDESNYTRELAPLAGHYPAVKLGPPWWFNDSLEGITRFLHQVTETTGLYNLAGFNDDTRAYPSLPARHDLWRRVCANWAAGLVVRGIVDADDAAEMLHALAYTLAKKAYRLDN